MESCLIVHYGIKLIFLTSLDMIERFSTRCVKQVLSLLDLDLIIFIILVVITNVSLGLWNLNALLWYMLCCFLGEFHLFIWISLDLFEAFYVIIGLASSVWCSWPIWAVPGRSLVLCCVDVFLHRGVDWSWFVISQVLGELLCLWLGCLHWQIELWPWLCIHELQIFMKPASELLNIKMQMLRLGLFTFCWLRFLPIGIGFCIGTFLISWHSARWILHRHQRTLPHSIIAAHADYHGFCCLHLCHTQIEWTFDHVNQVHLLNLASSIFFINKFSLLPIFLYHISAIINWIINFIKIKTQRSILLQGDRCLLLVKVALVNFHVCFGFATIIDVAHGNCWCFPFVQCTRSLLWRSAYLWMVWIWTFSVAISAVVWFVDIQGDTFLAIVPILRVFVGEVGIQHGLVASFSKCCHLCWEEWFSLVQFKYLFFQHLLLLLLVLIDIWKMGHWSLVGFIHFLNCTQGTLSRRSRIFTSLGLNHDWCKSAQKIRFRWWHTITK